MDKIRKNESDYSVSFSITAGNSIAVSELSMFPKESTLEFINASNLSEQQKLMMVEALNNSCAVYFYSRLKVPRGQEGKGFGTKLLEETISFIKEKNAFLVNTANAYGEKDQDSLIKFYQKNGMILIHKDGGLVYSPSLNPEDFNIPQSKKGLRKK